MSKATPESLLVGYGKREYDTDLTNSRFLRMHNVLIVDEEEHLLWALEQNLFPDRKDIVITSCTTGEEGLEKLQHGDFDLLVCDIKMPGKIDGFQLILRAKEIASEAKVIIMTAFGTNRIQSFAERIGVTHYVEKPFNTIDLRNAILEALDQQEGFRGVLHELELTDIVQMLCLAKRSSMVHLKHKENRGLLVFEKGQIVHAVFNEETGNDAVYKMLALKKGDIFMQSDYQNDEVTVSLSWQDLLFEGVRLADEASLAEASSHEDNLNEESSLSGIEEFPLDDPDTFFGTDDDPPSLEDLTSLGVGHDDSFFSDAELQEIEAVGLTEFSESASSKLPGFTREVSEVTKTMSDEMILEVTRETDKDSAIPNLEDDDDLSGFDPFGEQDIEFRSPFSAPESSEFRSIENLALVEVVTPSEIREALQDFSSQCMGLKLAAVISPDDGLVLNSIDLDLSDQFDAEGFAPFVRDIVRCAQQTTSMVKKRDSFEELQVELETENVLIRVLTPTTCVLTAVVDKTAPLGLALILMKKFHGQLLSSATL